MTNLEQLFADELEVFRSEAEAGAQYFYTYLTFNALLADNENYLKAVNRTPRFWKTVVSALQVSFFMVLGRIFDQDQRKSNHNVDMLLGLAQRHPEIFSKSALAARKRKDSRNADEWLDEYLKGVYEPTIEDFRRLRKHIRKYRRIYEHAYRDIRHKFYAHKGVAEEARIRELFDKTKVRELESLFVFLLKLHASLWQLFHNGRKPILRPIPYAVKRIMQRRVSPWQSRSIQEHVVEETTEFLLSFAGKAQQRATADVAKRRR